jgi:hypothetical protein
VIDVPRNMDKENDDLLDALESIKGLLEKGESKLSAARESLAKAKSSPRRPATGLPVSNDPIVPVLDDIVSPAIDDDDDALLFDDVPELYAVHELEEEMADTSTAPGGYSTDQVLALIDSLHDTLVKELHSTLINALVSIEADIKTSLHEQIQNIKDRIEQDREN